MLANFNSVWREHFIWDKNKWTRTRLELNGFTTHMQWQMVDMTSLNTLKYLLCLSFLQTNLWLVFIVLLYTADWLLCQNWPEICDCGILNIFHCTQASILDNRSKWGRCGWDPRVTYSLHLNHHALLLRWKYKKCYICQKMKVLIKAVSLLSNTRCFYKLYPQADSCIPRQAAVATGRQLYPPNLSVCGNSPKEFLIWNTFWTSQQKFITKFH
jgi:hypothetical protein